MSKKSKRGVVFMATLVLCGFGECQRPQTMSLLMAGYSMISPPSNLFTPGAIVLMQSDEQGHTQLKLVCGPRANLGAHWMPRVSETMSGSFKLSRTQRIELEADAVERFKARTKVEEVATVQVVLSNAKVLEISEEEVVTGVEYRTEACTRAIEARLSNGYRPTFVTSAYAADVEYIVSFKREAELSKAVRKDRMTRIAANLGGGHTQITEHTLKAVNLILALKADEFLMQVKPCGVRQSDHNDAGPRMAPVLEALPEPDAPLVPPAGGWASPVFGG